MKPFQFCKVCKLSYNEGRQHCYSRRHQDRFQKLVQREWAKLDVLRRLVRSSGPIEDVDEVPNWCHFCHVEVPRTGPAGQPCALDSRRPHPLVSAAPQGGGRRRQ